jgi:hypothetical protein
MLRRCDRLLGSRIDGGTSREIRIVHAQECDELALRKRNVTALAQHSRHGLEIRER